MAGSVHRLEIILLIKANQGQMYKLPIIGDLAEKQANAIVVAEQARLASLPPFVITGLRATRPETGSVLP